jgi:signal transduction histidine kinase
MTLRLRFSLVILGLILLAQAMFGAAYYFLQKNAELSENAERSMRTVRLTAAVCRQASLTGDWTRARSQAALLREDPLIRFADCVDGDGRSLTSALPGTGKPLPPNGRDGVWEVSRSFELAAGDSGRVRIGFDANAVDAEVDARLARAVWDMARVASVTLLFGLVAAFAVARTLTKPIEALASAARAVESGNLDHRIEPDGRSDELETLRVRFNAMAARLAETDRLKRNFVQSFTHDLKNPLSGIKACIASLHAGSFGEINDKQRKYLGTSLEASERLWDYIEDILSVMKLQTGRFPTRIERVEAEKTARSCAESFALKAKETLVDLRVEFPEDIPPVRADAELLRRVFDNLVSNALNFTPRGGKVTIGAGRENGFVRFEVRDTGPGIPGEDLERVFESFHQVEANREKARKPGTGLGLAICRSIVREHGGTIRAETPASGGTRISFTLPTA